jgi:hypothetical protein
MKGKIIVKIRDRFYVPVYLCKYVIYVVSNNLM